MLTTENGTAKPDPEVLEKPQRRRFTAEYKRSVLREYEASPKGERGALLRREGLYSSLISTWQAQVTSGELKALAPRKRGRKPAPKPDPELERLQRENTRLQRELLQAKKVIAVQKKISELLGIEQNLPDELKEEF
jgi:transposase-like protein